jgi:hypothetical protein
MSVAILWVAKRCGVAITERNSVTQARCYYAMPNDGLLRQRLIMANGATVSLLL